MFDHDIVSVKKGFLTNNNSDSLFFLRSAAVLSLVTMSTLEVAAWFVLWGLAPVVQSALASSKKKDSTATTNNSMKKKPLIHVFGVDRAIDIDPKVFPTQEELDELEGYLPPHEHLWYPSVVNEDLLHYRKISPPTSSPKAVVIYQHGIATHGGKAYIMKGTSSHSDATAKGRKLNASILAEVFCQQNNMLLYLPDMWSHGYSEGSPRWLIPGKWKDTSLQDLIHFVQMICQQHADLPVFLLGESWGGTLTIHTARHFQDCPLEKPSNFDSILLTGPAIVGDLPPAPVVFVLRYLLAPFFPRWRPFFMPNTLTPDRIWRDEEVRSYRTSKRYSEMSIDGSGIPFRLGTAVNLLLGLEECRRSAIPGFRLPFCIVHGVNDLGVPVEGSDYLWETADTPTEDKAYDRVEDGRHDMLSDHYAEEAMDFFMKFIQKRLAKRQSVGQ